MALTEASSSFTFILYGVAMTGIGMLTLTGNNVAMDSFGPIADNANGIGEMAGLEPEARQIMADLDAVGNTTKAITKGIAIGSAVIAAVSLFGSFITDVSVIDPNALAMGIRASEPIVFVGILLGGALPWLFSSLAIRAVGRAAGQMVEEVRRQFKIPGILEGTVKPDYARAVTISTVAAQRDLINLADSGGGHTGGDRLVAAGGGAGWVPGRDHRFRHVAGRVHVQHGRCLGQCQEAD